MKNYITTIKYLLSTLLLVAFVFFGRGAPTAQASHGNPDFPDWPSGTLTTDGSAHPYFFRVDHNAPPYGITLTDANPIFNRSAVNETNYSDPTNGGSTGANYIFSDPDASYGLTYGSCTDGTYLLTVFDQYSTKTVAYQNEITVTGGCTSITPESLVDMCPDGIMNQDETGIDIGGVCATVTINTPVDTTDVQDFNNFSVTYHGVDIQDQNHQVLVQWSDSSSLLTTCNDGVAGSMYTGSFVAGSSYSVCTNSIPRIFIDLNTISFSQGITSYTGSVPKTHSLVNGTTYYAQAFIVGDDGFYYVASDVISFTASNGVPIVTGNGTITNTAGSGTITGTSTHFTNTLHIGDTLTVGGQQCKVLSIASDTELECTPLTSAHTGASYTQNSNFDNSVLQETCSTWDFGCYIKNTISWFFGVSDSTLQNFGTLKDSLFSRFPFSYIDDVGTLFGETFDQSADTFSLDIDLLGNSFTVLSTAQLEAIPFQSLVRTIMGAMAMFFTVMFIYRKIIKVHDANHKTA